MHAASQALNYFYSTDVARLTKYARAEQVQAPCRLISIGNGIPMELSNSNPSIIASQVISADSLALLVSESSLVIQSLAFLPTNPAHELVVDRLMANRIANAKSRKLAR